VNRRRPRLHPTRRWPLYLEAWACSLSADLPLRGPRTQSGRYRRAIERTCRLPLHRDAEDCAQEAFIRIWQKAPLFDHDRGSAATWLLTVTRSVA
jgi:Sigma-70 region 2